MQPISEYDINLPELLQQLVHVVIFHFNFQFDIDYRRIFDKFAQFRLAPIFRLPNNESMSTKVDLSFSEIS